MKLRKTKKTFRAGTHRTTTPERTEKWAAKKIAKSGLPVYFGLKRIDSVDKLGLPVYTVEYPDVFNNTKKPFVITCCKGKGLTPTAARVSALMERVERFSASDVDLSDLTFAAFDELDGAVSRWDFVPCNLQRKLYTKEQLDALVLPWTKAYSLSREEKVYVPANLAYFRSFQEYNDFSYTTGLAAGNTLEEAILHGLCEVVERHVQELVYRNGEKTPVLALETVRDPALKKLIAKFTAQGLTLKVNVVSLNTGIPAFGVFAVDSTGSYVNAPNFYAAVGVHPDKKVALTRALTELAQERTSVLNGLKNDEIRLEVTETLPKAIEETYTKPLDYGNVVSFDTIADTADSDIAVEIRALTGRLTKNGCDVIVKDLTHPKIGIPVVRVLVKGLQPGIFGVGIGDTEHEVAQVSEYITVN